MLEFLCLSVAKLLVLHRMSNFAAAKGDDMSRRLAVVERVMMAAVVLGDMVGFCGNVATAVCAKKCGEWLKTMLSPRALTFEQLPHTPRTAACAHQLCVMMLPE